MILYADRGIVKSGVISDLFQNLYLTITVALSVVFYFMTFSWHLSKDEDDPFMMKICLKEEYDELYRKDFKYLIELISFMILILLLIWIMYGKSRFYLFKNTTNGKLPSKFGRYQRNILTFYDTILVTSVQLFLLLIVLLIVSILYDKKIMENLQIILLLLIFGIKVEPEPEPKVGSTFTTIPDSPYTTIPFQTLVQVTTRHGHLVTQWDTAGSTMLDAEIHKWFQLISNLFIR